MRLRVAVELRLAAGSESIRVFSLPSSAIRDRLAILGRQSVAQASCDIRRKYARCKLRRILEIAGLRFVNSPSFTVSTSEYTAFVSRSSSSAVVRASASAAVLSSLSCSRASVSGESSLLMIRSCHIRMMSWAG